MTVTSRPKIVVLGMMSNLPFAGVVWQTIHYLVGFERLGYDVYYVEAHGSTPTKLMRGEDDDGPLRASEFVAGVMRRFGFGDRWAYHAPHDGDRYFGMSDTALRRLYAEAAVIINLHGSTVPLPEHSATGRLVYVETDPVAVQVQLAEGRADTIAYLEPHCAFFTFGENYGRPGCGLPVSDRFRFQPTRQPVVLDFWDGAARGAVRDAFTTVGNWKQAGHDIRLNGDVYRWSKHHEFLKFLDLPARSGCRFELALSRVSLATEDRARLEAHGWAVRDALEISDDPDAYREYIATSRGEFTVAKDQNIRLRTGWFSDRSATYLAAGRPVITQDTGFGDVLPTGEGLFAFDSAEGARDAVHAASCEPRRHSRAAKRIAAEHFSSHVVLAQLLETTGLQGRVRP